MTQENVHEALKLEADDDQIIIPMFPIRVII